MPFDHADNPVNPLTLTLEDLEIIANTRKQRSVTELTDSEKLPFRGNRSSRGTATSGASTSLG